MSGILSTLHSEVGAIEVRDEVGRSWEGGAVKWENYIRVFPKTE